MYFNSPVASRRLISSARAFCSSVHNPCLSMKPGGVLMPAQLPGDPGNQCVARPDHPVGTRPALVWESAGDRNRPSAQTASLGSGEEPTAAQRNAGALQAPEQ